MYEEYDSLDFFFFFEASFLGACGAVRPSTTAARRRGGLCSLSRVRGGSAGVGAGQRGSGARPQRSRASRGRARDRLARRFFEWDGVWSGERLTLADFLLGVLAMLSSVCFWLR